MTDDQCDWLHARMPEGKTRMKIAFYMMGLCLIFWPATHVAVIMTKPPELASWTGHLLLAISWAAIFYSAMTQIEAADVRREQDRVANDLNDTQGQPETA